MHFKTEMMDTEVPEVLHDFVGSQEHGSGKDGWLGWKSK